MRSVRVELPEGNHTVVECFASEGRSSRALVAFFPALGVSIDFYRGMAQAWAALGFDVGLIEARGMKQSSVRDVRTSNFGYREVLTVDVPAVLPALQREFPKQPLLLAGHSLGGQFALLHASRFGRADAVLLVAGGSNYYGSMPKGLRTKRQLSLNVARGLARVLGYFPGDKLKFGGRQPRNLMLDWTEEALTGRYRVLGDDFDYEAALTQLELPVLLLSLQGDPLVPKSCADFLAAKLTRARVSQVELQASEYGQASLHHFRWAKRAEPVLAHVDRWAGSALARAQVQSPQPS